MCVCWRGEKHRQPLTHNSEAANYLLELSGAREDESRTNGHTFLQSHEEARDVALQRKGRHPSCSCRSSGASLAGKVLTCSTCSLTVYVSTWATCDFGGLRNVTQIFNTEVTVSRSPVVNRASPWITKVLAKCRERRTSKNNKCIYLSRLWNFKKKILCFIGEYFTVTLKPFTTINLWLHCEKLWKITYYGTAPNYVHH